MANQVTEATTNTGDVTVSKPTPVKATKADKAGKTAQANDPAATYQAGTGGTSELDDLIGYMKDAATLAKQIRRTRDPNLKAQYQTQLADKVTSIKDVLYNSSSGNGDFIIGGDAAQGQIGDCYLLTGLNGVATRGDAALKDALKNRVHVNDANGTISVDFNRQVFRDGQVQDVTTTTQISAGDLNQIKNRGYYVRNAEAFANVLERGYAEFRVATHQVHKAVIKGNESGLTSQFLKSVTGKAAYQQFTPLLSDSDLETNLQQVSANDGKYIMSADTNNQVSAGLVHNHAYLVKGYDSGSKTVTLVNPWDASSDVNVSLADFKSNFNFLDGIDTTA